MKKLFALALVPLIMFIVCGCKSDPGQQSAQPPDPQQALGEHVRASLDGALMTGWKVASMEECAAPNGWMSGSGKGWHIMVVSPETEAGALQCNFWVFQPDWSGQKPPGSETPAGIYYGHSGDGELMFFVQPPDDPAYTDIAVSQVAQALGVPDMRAVRASQTDERAKEIRTQMLAAAGQENATLARMIRSVVESKYAVIVFLNEPEDPRNAPMLSADPKTMTLLNALRQTFPEKRTFIINRYGANDSIVVHGR